MSLDVYTVLRTEECVSRVTRAVPLAQVEVQGLEVTIINGRNRVRLTLEEWGPTGDSFGGIRTRVNLSSITPQHEGKSLEQSMREEERFAETVRYAIRALRPVEICSSSGKLVSLREL